ncbi:RidA family protein [Falsiroseomonas sp.]|uniref:RidA family protein n=1 Tax=Falsiroseomonas sp. TaxID=2870721 RepID=UPI003563622B
MRAVPVIALIPTVARGAAEEVKRHRMPGSDLPVAMAVEVPAGATMVHLSGATPALRPDGSYGDTRTQTRGALRSLEDMLRRLGLDLGDVVRMQAFLVGDPAQDGRMDTAGFMAAYREFFGTSAQPNLPARTVVQVAGLADPRLLVEIEVSAARSRR